MTQSGFPDPQGSSWGQPPAGGQAQSQQGFPPPAQQWQGQAPTYPPMAPYAGPMTGTSELDFQVPAGSELASVGRRIGGYFMEALLLIVTLVIGYIIWTLVVWGRGQSPGKQVLGMYCYRPATGLTAGWGFMFLRWIGNIIESVVGFVFIISGIMMIVSKDHKAIHDHIAGTVVLHRTS